MAEKHGAAVAALATLLLALLLHGHALADAIVPAPTVQFVETFAASADVFADAGVADANITLVGLSNDRFIGPDAHVLAFTGAADARVPLLDAALPDFSAPRAIVHSPVLSLDAAAFDSWLMLFVGAGLIAVQLRRKQRELRRPRLVI